YELVYILKPSAGEEKRAQLLEKLRDIIEVEGTIENVDEWGNRKLAYEIDKINEGYYVLVNFKSGTEIINELNRNLRIADEVMRHLIVKIGE
ncbi:MAG TPA: 30S ribosomal protein S6, partial [Clostridia bacterium]|nr:30S ribosomal protein S6 [Clostridia bacterium]